MRLFLGSLFCYTDLCVCFYLFKSIQGILWVCENFRIACTASVRNDIEILIGIALNLLIALGGMDT